MYPLNYKVIFSTAVRYFFEMPSVPFSETAGVGACEKFRNDTIYAGVPIPIRYRAYPSGSRVGIERRRVSCARFRNALP